MSKRSLFYFSIVSAITIVISGCSDPKAKAIDELCVGLEKISDPSERNEIYMQCRKACGDAEIYNVEEGKKKNMVTKKCDDAGKVGDTQFKKSPKRNWLGVMP